MKTVMHVATALVLLPTSIATGVLAVQATDNNWEQVTTDALSTVHIVFINLAFAHVSILCSTWAAIVLTRRSAAFLYRRYVRYIGACMLHITVSLVYWFAAFRPRICASTFQTNAAMCSTVTDVYNSHILFVVATALMQCFALLLSGYTYITHRHQNWERMYELEDLFGFHPTLVDGETCRDVPRFCKYWIGKNSSDIIADIPDRASRILSVMVKDMDVAANGSINLAEFSAFAESNGLADADSIAAAWKILSDPRTGLIGERGIQHALYDLSFCRRRLALLLLTDTRVVAWAMRYVAMIVYGACAVVAANMWGYDSFSTGVDLFKTYLLIITYALNASAASIRFLITMIIHRPYNIGDVLRLDADQVSGAGSTGGVGRDLYQVTKMTLGYTSLEGSILLQIPNPMSQLSTGDDVAAVVKAAVVEHARDSPFEIDPACVPRCTWSDVTCTYKELQCHWTYAPDICDTSMATHVMFNVRNAVLHRIWRRLKEDAIVMMSSSGGAFNTLTVSKFKAD
ncbi:hypothetical protein FOA52_005433 [Chlamydomonas sp. UWO 241]|nr:hypothetical protein FOA52_005433 [Chlamydomonas sp. UWO 241]